MSDYPSQNPEEPSADQAPKESQADRLIKLVKRKDIELFHDQYEDCWARIRFRDHSEIRKCRSRDFRRYLGLIYWQEYRKAPSSQTLSDATNVIESVARYEGECHALFNRVAWHEGRLYYDLADSKRRAVCITPEGWSIDDDPPILFRRYTHQKAQVAPESRGDLKSVLPFLNLRDESSERLVLVYVVSLFVPDIAHPISIIHGPQGAAKTTFLRCLRRMVDPSVTETLSLPSKLPELVQQLAHHWMPVFDNISKLPEWLSDDLCRACTGAGVSKRELYTDDDDIIYSFRRCVALNGINIVAQKADLLDRSLLFGLKAIQESARKPEADFWNDYEDALPYLLGAVFDVLSYALGIKDTIAHDRLPRMADFAIWGSAISQALGFDPQSFPADYRENMNLRNQEILVSSPVAVVVTKFMEDRSEWEGTATKLLSELNKIAGTIHVRTDDRLWPKAANILSQRLNEIVPNLASAGLEVDTGGCRGKQRVIAIRRIPQKTVGTVEVSDPPEVPSNDMSRDLQKPSEVPLPLSDLDTVAYGDTDDTDDTISKVSKGKRKEIRI